MVKNSQGCISVCQACRDENMKTGILCAPSHRDPLVLVYPDHPQLFFLFDINIVMRIGTGILENKRQFKF